MESVTRIRSANLHVVSSLALSASDCFSAENAVQIPAWKRLFDVVCSLVALFGLMPLFLCVAVAIRLDSRGPVLFRQPRVGLHGKVFSILKFRTMKFDACDPTGIEQTRLGDARVTTIGRVLRRLSIDELPQLLNVLVGDMSLVGPRPHPVGMLVEGVRYEELVERYHLRHIVRPGLTGLAQIHGFRGAVLTEAHARERFRLDCEYVVSMGPWLDLKIFVITILREMRRPSGS
jgi:lipopolysaccharide/colanic/teichoic acid biosynthesis glycosyltransferase